MFYMGEFQQLMGQLAETAESLGFSNLEVLSESEVSFAFRSTIVTLLLEERGMQVVAEVQHPSGSTSSFEEVSEYFECLHPPATFLSSRDQAQSIIIKLLSHFSTMLGALLESSPHPLEKLEEWTNVNRALSMQHYTAEKRSPERWSLIMGAWREKRYESVVRLVQSLPTPLTDAEERAVQFASNESAT